MDFPIRLADQMRAHLRALRKQRGLTQAQLGQRLGIGQARIAEIESKPGLVSLDQLVKLVSVLGATLVLRDLAKEAMTPQDATTARSPGKKSSGTKLTPRARGDAQEAKTAPLPASRKSAVDTRRKASRKAAPDASRGPAPVRKHLAIPPKKGSW